MTDHKTERKLQLIEEILKIIFANVNFVNLKEEQRVSFVKEWPGNPQIWRLMEMYWNDKFDFVVLEYVDKRWVGVYVPTSKWFAVRDLLRKKFLDAEKLKL